VTPEQIKAAVKRERRRQKLIRLELRKLLVDPRQLAKRLNFGYCGGLTVKRMLKQIADELEIALGSADATDLADKALGADRPSASGRVLAEVAVGLLRHPSIGAR